MAKKIALVVTQPYLAADGHTVLYQPGHRFETADADGLDPDLLAICREGIVDAEEPGPVQATPEPQASRPAKPAAGGKGRGA